MAKPVMCHKCGLAIRDVELMRTPEGPAHVNACPVQRKGPDELYVAHQAHVRQVRDINQAQTLKHKIDDRKTAMFRTSLLDRVAHGETLAAVGDHVLYFDGMAAVTRKVKASDIATIGIILRHRAAKAAAAKVVANG